MELQAPKALEYCKQGLRGHSDRVGRPEYQENVKSGGLTEKASEANWTRSHSGFILARIWLHSACVLRTSEAEDVMDW